TQPLLLPRADRPAAALVPSTSHGAARIMIELRNKHTFTGKLCRFQIVLFAQLVGDFLSQSLKSKGLCRRIHFRRMPSVNDGSSELPDSGLAASTFGWFTTSRISVSRPRVLLVQPLRARPRPSPQLGVLPLRQPLSSRSWQLRALPPWPLRARPCGRLHAPPPPPPRVARVRQPRSSLSQRLRALPASPPRARLFAQRRAPPSRQLYASLARWLRAARFLFPRVVVWELRLLCCLALRLLRSFAPGFLRGGKPCSLGCGFATRGLSPGLFCKRVELGGIELCLLCSGLELRHLLPCRICVRTTLLRGAFCLPCGGFVLGGEVGGFRCSSLQRRNADSNLLPLGRRCSPALLELLDIQFGFRFRFFWHGGHVQSGLSISVQ